MLPRQGRQADELLLSPPLPLSPSLSLPDPLSASSEGKRTSGREEGKGAGARGSASLPGPWQGHVKNDESSRGGDCSDVQVRSDPERCTLQGGVRVTTARTGQS